MQIKEIVATNVRRQRSAAAHQRRKSKQSPDSRSAARPAARDNVPPRRNAGIARPANPIVDMPAKRRPSRPKPAAAPVQAKPPAPATQLPPRTPLSERRPSNEQIIDGPTPVTPQPEGQTTRATPSAAYSASQATFDTPDESWLPLNYQPGDRAALRTFVTDCLMKGEALVPCATPAEPGQPFVLLITHPATAEEMRVYGRVRAIHGEGATQVVEVGFIRTDVGGVAEVDAFVGDNDPEVVEAERVKAQRLELRRTAGANPKDPVVHIALGWFELIDSSDEQAAIDAFLEAITMDPGCIEGYHGLALAHALAGETKRALAFAASARRLAGY